MKFGSLFSGVGGLDLGLERAGMECVWMVEIDDYCTQVLEKHWPSVMKHKDVRDVGRNNLKPVDLVAGGDPCPAHSRARGGRPSRHPDMSGYFLAVVGGLRPRWVVRENVPSSTTEHFDAALDALGYGTSIIRLDSAKITGQSRQRDFIIGCYQATRESIRNIFSDCQDGEGTCTTSLKTRQVAPALTTHRTRYDSRDCYIFESGRLRILDGDERESLAGFPKGWTAGFSETARARMYGNAVVPAVAQYIGERICECDKVYLANER